MRPGLDAQERAVIIGSSRHTYDLESIESALRSQWSNEEAQKDRGFTKRKVTTTASAMHGEDTITWEEESHTATQGTGGSYQDSDLYDEVFEEISDNGAESDAGLRQEECTALAVVQDRQRTMREARCRATPNYAKALRVCSKWRFHGDL